MKSCDLSDTVTAVAGTLYELYVRKCSTLAATVYCQSGTVSDFCQLNDWRKDVTWFLELLAYVSLLRMFTSAYLLECLNVCYHIMSQISVFLMSMYICVNSRPTEHVRSVYEVASIIFRWYKVVETKDSVHQLILQICSLWSGFTGQWQLIIYHLMQQIKYRSVLNCCFLLQMWCGSTFGCICHYVTQGHQSRSRSQK